MPKVIVCHVCNKGIVGSSYCMMKHMCNPIQNHKKGYKVRTIQSQSKPCVESLQFSADPTIIKSDAPFNH